MTTENKNTRTEELEENVNVETPIAEEEKVDATATAQIFDKLYGIDVTSHLEEKNGLTYLSWAWAWAELCKVYPNATYEFKLFKDKDGNEVPFQDLGPLGCLVHTSICVDGMVRTMSLPVMDASNKPMKTESYKYKVKDKNSNEYERVCEAYDIMNINKTLWRCLVKNIAMFGLGLKVYSGDDLPPEIDPETGEVMIGYKQLKRGGNAKGDKKSGNKSTTTQASEKQIALIKKLYNETYLQAVCKQLKIENIEAIDKQNASKLIENGKKQNQ